MKRKIGEIMIGLFISVRKRIIEREARERMREGEGEKEGGRGRARVRRGEI